MASKISLTLLPTDATSRCDSELRAKGSEDQCSMSSGVWRFTTPPKRAWSSSQQCILSYSKGKVESSLSSTRRSSAKLAARRLSLLSYGAQCISQQCCAWRACVQGVRRQPVHGLTPLHFATETYGRLLSFLIRFFSLQCSYVQWTIRIRIINRIPIVTIEWFVIYSWFNIR